RGTLNNANQSDSLHVGGVQVLGVGPEFWKLGDGGPTRQPSRDEIVLNRTLAERLGAEVGAEVILRLSHAAEVPADSPLGRKTETIRSRRFTALEIIDDSGVGCFGISPTQQSPLNAFTAIDPLERMLELDGKVNAVLVAGKSAESVAPIAA